MLFRSDLGRVGAELFGWLILLAAVAMAADWMLANRFYAPLETAPAASASGFGAEGEPTSDGPPPLPRGRSASAPLRAEDETMHEVAP